MGTSGFTLIQRMRLLSTLLVAGALVACSAPREAAPARTTPPSGATPAAPSAPRAKTYSSVIPATAKTERGMFTVHRVGAKLFYEIPVTELGNLYLMVNRIAAAQANQGFSGQNTGNMSVRWVRNGDKILLRSVSSAVRADTSKSISFAVAGANYEPIVAAFDIETWNPDSSAVVIDVTPLYTTDVSELSPRRMYQGRRIDPSRSMIESARAFPDNIEVRSTYTVEREAFPSTISVLMNFSMVRLPEVPMRPRIFDERVGYFSVGTVDFSAETHYADRQRFITRWRLEKKDPNAAISEPVKPITYWVDRGTPEWLVPYVVKGIEDWQPAFEQAGFRNGIVARIAPTEAEDPDWSHEDARYPTVRWVPSTIENAVGPHVNDPRSGEIITTSVYMYHNVMNLLKNWYFIQASANDISARNFPLPDSLMGELVRYVVAHEVGHTLGLPHNMKASASVPVDSLRSPTFTRKYGTTPSMMDYARNNYVAQPGDDVALMPIVSIYDKFSIEWGYTPFPQATSAEDEARFLEPITRRQDNEPMLRFGNPSQTDPTQLTESLGDDAVKATRYGMNNMRTIMGYLLDATTDGTNNYDLLGEMYNQVLAQRTRMINHVVVTVGGVVTHQKRSGQDGPLYLPVDRAKQKEALDYLLAEAFTTPTWLIREDILRLIEPSGTGTRLMNSQRSTLNSLLTDDRINRMAELGLYLPTDMMNDLRAGLFSELSGRSVTVDLYRRNLQRAFVDILGARLAAEGTSGETRALFRGNLRDLGRSIDSSIGRVRDDATRYHLEDLKAEIQKILDPS